jgi:hypothetical protein
MSDGSKLGSSATFNCLTAKLATLINLVAITEVFLGVGCGIMLTHKRGRKTPCCVSGARVEIEKAH